jgi:hypothetical protein
MTVPYTFGTATTSIPLSNLDANFNTPITLGNTSIYLGNTTTTIGNLTLTNVTISSGSANISSSYTTANAVVYTNSSNVGITSSSLKFDGTNLGIAVTPSAWFSDYRVLQLADGTSLSGRTGNPDRTQLMSNVYRDSAAVYRYIASGFATEYIQASGIHSWSTASSGTVGNAITLTTAMSLDGNGGITTFNGTNASGSYIQVQNSGSTTTYLGSWLRLIGSGAADDSVVYTNGAKLGFVVNATIGGFFNSAGGLQTLNTIGVGNTAPSTSGAGITFPATQSASSNANTLDDYEEGTWTMALAFGGASTGVAYTTRTNNYTFIGNRVYFDLLIQTSSKGSSTGDISISLPIVASSGVADAVITGFLDGGAVTAAVQINGRIIAGSSTMAIFSYTTGNAAALTDANVNNVTVYRFSGSYQK